MENKCNKKSHNNKILNSKYMEQLFCHTNPNRQYSNKISISSNGSGNSTIPSGDLLTLFKENKQLKTMLILHLDLIQEQNDQLIAKDKILLTQSEELQHLNAQNNVLQNQLQDLQKQLQRQIKRIGDVSTVPPPPLAKIQCNFHNLSNRSTFGQLESVIDPNTKDAINFNSNSNSNSNSNYNSSCSQKPPHIIGECNGKLISKIILQKISRPVKSEEYMQSPQTTTDTEYTEDDDHNDNEDIADAINESEYENDHALKYDNCDANDCNSRHIDEISDVDIETDKKQKLFEYQMDEQCATSSNQDNCNLMQIKSNSSQIKQKKDNYLQKEIAIAETDNAQPTDSTNLMSPQIYKIVAMNSNSNSNSNSNTATESKSSLPINNYNKQTSMMDWKTSSGHIDESDSSDSTIDIDNKKTAAGKNANANANASSTKSTLDNNDNKRSIHSKILNSNAVQQQKSKRSFLLTNQLYYTREWEDESFAVQNDCEFIKEEAKALDSDIPMLEIPKWTEHELSPLYCMEGTEDLSDETFIKRHAKLEIDEKRRKKWDVQQIREQRRIEKLKRRHCKDELTSSQDQQLIHSFYPPTEAVQSICYVENLPVQAFGEMIPCLNGNHDQQNFSLPWLDKDYKNQATCSNNNFRSTVLTMDVAQATNTSSLQSQQQMLKSSFVFVKKRKRHQSSAATTNSGAGSSTRQRHSTSHKSNATQSQTCSRHNSEYAEPSCSNASHFLLNNVRN